MSGRRKRRLAVALVAGAILTGCTSAKSEPTPGVPASQPAIARENPAVRVAPGSATTTAPTGEPERPAASDVLVSWEWLHPALPWPPMLTFASDGTHVVGAGQDGNVIVSGDGGVNWRGWKLPIHDPLVASCAAGDHVYVLERTPADADHPAGGTRALRSLDGGKTWRAVFADPNRRLQAILGFAGGADRDEVWLAGEAGMLVHSSDGAHFTVVSGPVKTNLRAAWAGDRGHAFIAGDAGEVLQLVDGKAWQRVTSAGADTDLYSISGATSADGKQALVVTGISSAPVRRQRGASASVVARSEDGGRSWQRVAGVGIFSPMLACSGARCLAGGTSVFASDDAGQTWRPRPDLAHGELTGAAETAAATVLSFRFGVMGVLRESRDGAHFVAAADGPALTTSDGGKTWDSGHAPTAAGFTDVWAITPHEVFVAEAGLAHRLLHSTDGGKTLRPVTLADPADAAQPRPPARVRQVWARPGDARHLYALADDIYASGDGGATWKRLHVDGADALAALTGSSSALYAVGDGGTILHSNDGGTTWAPAASGTQADLDSVAAWGDSVVAVGDTVVVRSTDRGATWETLLRSEDPRRERFGHVTASKTAATVTGALAIDDGGAPAGVSLQAWEIRDNGAPDGEKLTIDGSAVKPVPAGGDLPRPRAWMSPAGDLLCTTGGSLALFCGDPFTSAERTEEAPESSTGPSINAIDGVGAGDGSTTVWAAGDHGLLMSRSR